MKFTQFIVIALAIVVFFACKKEDPNSLPSCIDQKLVEFDFGGACPTGAKIDEFAFRGKTVFVFDPGTCGADLSSEVVDQNCNTLGYLGGFTGNTIIEGEDFSSAQFVRNHWQN